jgi:uncharacterized protein YgiM (DUF1202 family)
LVLLRAKIPANKEVSVAVAANPNGWSTGWHGSYDYKGLANNSDYLMVMTCDEHYEGGEAGPVASLDFVETSIKYALQNTSADKVVIGLPFFGRIWSTDGGYFAGSGVSNTTTTKLIRDYNGVVTFDEKAKSPKAEFEVKDTDPTTTIGGRVLLPGKYVVWYENDESIAEKLKLIRQYNLKGAGSWALSQEEASLWTNYSSWLNGESQNAEVPAWVANTTDLNIRSGPNTSSVIVTTLKENTLVTITGDSENNFYPVRLSDGRTGFASLKYLTMTNPSGLLTNLPAWVTGTSALNVRSEPNASSKVLTTISENTMVTLMGESTTNFYPVGLSDGTTGYVSSRYITTESPVTQAWVLKSTANLNVRQLPDLSATLIAIIPGGTKVSITGKETNGFYPVRLSDGRLGYTSLKYIITSLQ